jgi:hypothetical protein
VRGETKVGLGILGAAVVLGLAGDALLRATPYGLNVVLWTVALLAALFALARWRRPLLLGARRAMLVPLLACAALFLWRDSSSLAALNALALLASAGLCAASIEGTRLRSLGVGSVGRAWSAFAGSLAFGAVETALDVDWKEVRPAEHVRRVSPLAAGIAIAAPFLLVFGALLATADAVFGELLGALAPDVDAIAPHVLAAVFFAWLAAGALRGLLAPARSEQEQLPIRTGRRSGTEIVVALALVDALFLLFVAVQLGTFFGGDALVRRELGLTYAEYAREGFFQLVAATALAVPLLLAADWLLRGASRRVRGAARALSLALVCLLLVVVASALQRLRLYTGEFGLTEARVFATAAVLWLAVVLAWLAVARRERFAPGALAAAFAALLTLNAVNPDGLIARTNLARAAEGKPVDVRYLTRLSDDATPALLDGLDRLEQSPRARLAAALLERGRDGDWRTWNASRARAQELVRAEAARLRELAG